MAVNDRGWKIFAGLSGFVAIAMGAVGAHAVADPHNAALAEQASLYQLIHAAVLLYLCGQSGRPVQAARWLFLLGTILFCGSLYLKAISGWPDAVRPAPMGGISFMLGWVLIALGAFAQRGPGQR